MVVVACNTAAAAALELLRFECDVPVVERGRPRRAGRWCGPPAAAGSASSARSAPSARAPTSGRCAPPGPTVELTCCGLPRLRRVRRAGRDRQRAGPRAGRAAAGPAGAGQGRHPAARLHPLPVPGPHHRRRDGPRRGAGRPRPTRPRSRCGPSSTTPAWAGASAAKGAHRFVSSGDVAWFRAARQPAPRPRARRRGGVGSGAERDRAGLLAASYPGPGGACSGYLVDDGDGTRCGSTPAPARWPTSSATSAWTTSTPSSSATSTPTTGATWRAAASRARTALQRTGFPSTRPPACGDRTYQAGLAAVRLARGGRRRPVDVGTMAFTFSRTDHGPETLAMRVDAGGRSLGYSADTGPGVVARGPGRRPRPGPVRGHRP